MGENLKEMCRASVFTHKVVSVWNSPPGVVVDKIEAFKSLGCMFDYAGNVHARTFVGSKHNHSNYTLSHS